MVSFDDAIGEADRHPVLVAFKVSSHSSARYVDLVAASPSL